MCSFDCFAWFGSGSEACFGILSGVTGSSTERAWVSVCPAVLWSTCGLVTAEPFLLCCCVVRFSCDFWATLHCSAFVTASSTYVGFLRSSVRSSLLEHLASSSLSCVILFVSASLASLRNLVKNPEANWFVPGSRLVSLCNLRGACGDC